MGGRDRAAGPERFIVSCGGPITHDTPSERVRELVQVGKHVRDNLRFNKN